MKKTILAAATISLAALAVTTTRARSDETGRQTPGRPRLAVVIVIDQFRYDYLSRFEDLFDEREGAFLRLRRQGAYFENATYAHATTYTGPGHAHVLSGGYAYETGMVGNRWFDRATGKVVAIAGDPSSHLVGGQGDESEGTSPRNLLGTTVGDELVLDGRSKVVTMALKSRAAILLGGKLGKAYWFDEKAGGFATSTYYASALPPWVEAWNARKIAASFAGKSWTPLVPESAFARSSEDDMPWEGEVYGLGRTFPHPISGNDSVCMSPFGNDLELDFARAAIEGEKLGSHAGPDLLAVSLSANDEVGHTFGPMSREVLDMTVRTDLQLGAFLRWLDATVPGSLVVLTADHGASPIPEYMARLGVEAHRIKKKELAAAVDKELSLRFGEAKWVVALEDPSVYLDWKRIDEKKLSHEEVEDAAARALATVPGIAGTFTRTQLLHGENGGTALGRSYQLAFFPERSGDVLLVTKPYSFWGKYAEKDYGDSHGSPYGYDAHVPLVFMGPGVQPGIVRDSVALDGLAPTLASLLGVDAPPCAEGKVLERVFPR
jgi:predicted AlkP superfamily pyrophosphatase or phosphodiesterase